MSVFRAINHFNYSNYDFFISPKLRITKNITYIGTYTLLTYYLPKHDLRFNYHEIYVIFIQFLL